MNPFNIDLKKILLILIALALPLISINTQQGPGSNGWYNKPFTYMADATSSLFFSFSSGTRETTTMYLNLIGIKKEIASLQSQNLELATRLAAMSELQKENDRLHALMEFKQSTKMQLIPAQVMGRDLLADHQTLLINKGTRHGLKNGQAVITTQGVVGYVFRPSVNESQILLITDRYSVVDGIVQRTRARGIIEGKNQSSCSLSYVERTEDVSRGDLIVTSGIDNIFPKGFPVATVESVEHKNFSVSLKIELKPVVDPNKVEEVFVIGNAENEDMSAKVAKQE